LRLYAVYSLNIFALLIKKQR